MNEVGRKASKYNCIRPEEDVFFAASGFLQCLHVSCLRVKEEWYDLPFSLIHLPD